MDRKLRTLLLVLALAILCWPKPALADAGTPLMWAGMFQLVFGNAIIGLLEGLLFSRVFGTARTASVLLMVAANYCSMSFGLLGFPWMTDRLTDRLLGDESLYRVGPLLVGCIVASFVASVVIEWPFCFRALRNCPRRWTQSWKASILLQSVSYAVLVPLYALISPITVITGVELDRSLAFARVEGVWVYYISPKDGDVYRIRPDGTRREPVTRAGIVEPTAFLTARWIAEDPRVDLWVTSTDVGFDERLVLQDIPVKPSEVWRADLENLHAERKGWTRWGHGLDFRGEPQRSIWLYASPWPGGGLLVNNSQTGSWFHVALETPLVQWAVRSPTLLPGNVIVFQLADQIVALHADSRKMGLITPGRGPAVILEAPEGAAAVR